MGRKLAVLSAAAVLVGLVPLDAAAQSKRTAFNTIFVELGGNALLYSLNYERITAQDIGLRIGFSYVSLTATAGSASSSETAVGIPITASYLGLGSGSSKFELGGGILFERFSGASSSGFGDEIKVGVFVPMATFIAGYRYVPVNGGFNFKVGFTPVYHPDVGLFPWGGMSFGYGF